MNLWIKQDDIPLPHERDALLQDMFINAGYQGADLGRLNRVRLRLEILFLSDITTTNGRQIDPMYLVDRCHTVSRSTYEWPEERPTATDFQFWTAALQRITGPGYYLHDSLGP